MAVANNSKELFNFLKKEVNSKMSNQIAIDLRTMYRQTIQDVVYGAYSPRGKKSYKRRYSLIANVFSLYNNTTSTLEIATKGIANLSEPQYGMVYDLLGLIEYGHGRNAYGDEYSFAKSGDGYAKPRPFNRVSYEKAKKINYNKYFK